MFHKKKSGPKEPSSGVDPFSRRQLWDWQFFAVWGFGGLGFGEMFGHMISAEESMSSDTLGVILIFFSALNFETFFKKSLRYGQA